MRFGESYPNFFVVHKMKQRQVRALFSIESRFRSSALGMTANDAHQYLSRGSSFLVNNKQLGQLALVSCAHIVHPFRFPHYYRDSMHWLEHVKPEDLEFEITLIDPHTGAALYAMSLPRQLLKVHEELDCCAFVFPKQLNVSRLVQEFNSVLTSTVNYTPQPFDIDETFGTGKVQCVGFDYSGNRMEQQVGKHAMLQLEGKTLSNEIETRARRRNGDALVACQEFRIDTAPHRLNFGMCGGPVTLLEDGKALGMVEGIAPDGTVHCLPMQVINKLLFSN